MKLPVQIFLLSFLFSTNNVFAQDTIHWRSDYKLTWHDFKGKPDTTLEFGAITYASIQYSFKSSGTSLHTKVYCYFNKLTSWVYLKSDIGLVHEQGHFDIAELFARRLRKAFKEYQFNALTVKGDLRSIFERTIKERKRMDDSYDKETNFSRNKRAQELWNQKIAQALKRLEQFKL
jgi:hypothetical protein